MTLSHSHQNAVTVILEEFPGARTRGFMRAIRRAIPGAELFEPIAAIPDAYLIEPDYRLVTIFEVEVTHPVPEEKLEVYADLWWGIDGLDWDLVLTRFNLIAGTPSVTDLDMGDYAIGTVIPRYRNPNANLSPACREFAAAVRARYSSQ